MVLYAQSTTAVITGQNSVNAKLHERRREPVQRGEGSSVVTETVITAGMEGGCWHSTDTRDNEGGYTTTCRQRGTEQDVHVKKKILQRRLNE